MMMPLPKNEKRFKPGTLLIDKRKSSFGFIIKENEFHYNVLIQYPLTKNKHYYTFSEEYVIQNFNLYEPSS